MLRGLLRLTGYAGVAAGFVALVVDGARSIANSAFQVTPLSEIAMILLGERYRTLQAAIPAFMWDPWLVQLLRLPALAVGLGLGFLLLWAGARPREEVGYVTRR